MRQINLNLGRIVIMDDEDFDRFADYHWYYKPERNGKQGYAMRHVRVDGKVETEYLHRAIMIPPAGHEVIFKNYDRVDCRRENLAVVTKEEARRHHRVRSDSKSGVKGVRHNPEGDTWSAFTYRDGHYHSLGAFFSKKEAIQSLERALISENPEMHCGPEIVDRDALLADRELDA
jgi:hypothetical protein